MVMIPEVIFRLSRRLSSRISVAAGIDALTGVRRSRRNDLLRLGSKQGGWVIPTGGLDRRSVCYCVGCGEDISFDLGLIDVFGCNVYGFDPTPKSIQYVRPIIKDIPAYHFAEVGLWNCEDRLRFFVPRDETHVSHSLVNLQGTAKHIEVPVRRLSRIMQDNGHDSLDLLKLDIEGAEYQVLDSLIEDELKIRVLCVEFDEFWNPLDRHYRKRIRNHVRKLLSNGFKMVDFRGNGNYTFVLQN